MSFEGKRPVMFTPIFFSKQLSNCKDCTDNKMERTFSHYLRIMSQGKLVKMLNEPFYLQYVSVSPLLWTQYLREDIPLNAFCLWSCEEKFSHYDVYCDIKNIHVCTTERQYQVCCIMRGNIIKCNTVIISFVILEFSFISQSRYQPSEWIMLPGPESDVTMLLLCYSGWTVYLVFGISCYTPESDRSALWQLLTPVSYSSVRHTSTKDEKQRGLCFWRRNLERKSETAVNISWRETGSGTSVTPAKHPRHLDSFWKTRRLKKRKKKKTPESEAEKRWILGSPCRLQSRPVLGLVMALACGHTHTVYIYVLLTCVFCVAFL